MTRTSASGPRTRGPLARAFPLVLAALLGIWWLALAPSSLGGPATYVLVQGRSMLPLLSDGDLAVARHQPGYAVGDLVVLRTEGGGLVIHRLVSGSAVDGWRTQGDNNAAPDAWTVPDDAVVGAYVLAVPGVGDALRTAASHPLLFAGLLSLMALLTYVPWHRRHVPVELSNALRHASHEPGRDGRPAGDYASLALSAAATLACLASVTTAFVQHLPVADLRFALAAAGLLVSGSTTIALAYRMFDGTGLPEPERSTHALSGRLYLVSALPAVADAVPVASATQLRALAEAERLPVLHRIDDWTGTHEFLLVTADQGAYRWTARATRARRRGATRTHLHLRRHNTA